MKNKEQIHDEQIAPLMERVLEICKANGIDAVASFHIPTDSDHDLHSTSILMQSMPQERSRLLPAMAQVFSRRLGIPN